MKATLILGPFLVALVAGAPAAVNHGGSDETPRFAAPVLLTVGDDALGAKLSYPSPRLYDIDGDGAVEMVLGDLRGRVHVSERAREDDFTQWSAPEPLKTGERALKFHNW